MSARDGHHKHRGTDTGHANHLSPALIHTPTGYLRSTAEVRHAMCRKRMGCDTPRRSRDRGVTARKDRVSTRFGLLSVIVVPPRLRRRGP